MSNSTYKHARDLAILNTIAEALNSAADVQQALARTLALVAERLDLQAGWVWLIDPETDQIYNAAAYNLPPYLREPVRMTGAPCWCLDSFRAGGLAPKNITQMGCSRLRKAAEDDRLEATQGLSGHASIPLMFRDKPLGVMNVTGPTGRRLTRTELRLLSTIGYQVGIAVERARLSEEATRLARAEERARIAREIHDTLAQSLTAIALHIEGALPHLNHDTERARNHLERALAMSRESLEEARRSVGELRAAGPGSQKTLIGALSDLARHFTAETGVRVSMEMPEQLSLATPVETELTAIVREALTNVQHHAQATEVSVSVRRRANTLHMTVHDNGRGFMPKSLPIGHHGIVGMRERARLLGGTLRLVSRPARGATITVIVPIEAWHEERATR
jgi:two-component system NarL family sensor kinase